MRECNSLSQRRAAGGLAVEQCVQDLPGIINLPRPLQDADHLLESSAFGPGPEVYGDDTVIQEVGKLHGEIIA